MSTNRRKNVESGPARSQEEELDALTLADHGWWPEGTELVNYGAAGSGFAALSHSTPALELIRKEDELTARPEDREVALIRETRLRTLEAVVRELIGDGGRLDPVDIGLTVLTWGWDLQVPPLNNMTLEEIGELAGQTRAAICARHKRKVQRKKELAGQKGRLSSRQKSLAMVEVYRAAAAGNENRRMAKVRGALELNVKRKQK